VDDKFFYQKQGKFMRVTPQGGPKKGGPEARASLASP